MKKEQETIEPANDLPTQGSHEITKSKAEQIALSQIDALDQAQPSQVDLMSTYWSPEKIGEIKRVIFDRIDANDVLNQVTNEIIQLECAFFFVKEDGKIKRISNGSKRLVGTLQTYNIQQGSPLEIEYLGKMTNKTNGFKSDNWRVTPLIVNSKS